MLGDGGFREEGKGKSSRRNEGTGTERMYVHEWRSRCCDAKAQDLPYLQQRLEHVFFFFTPSRVARDAREAPDAPSASESAGSLLNKEV